MDCKRKMQVLRCGVLMMSIVMIGIGTYLQQPQQIFQQAIRICLECIGIG